MKKYWNAKTKKLMTEEEMKKSLKGNKANKADEEKGDAAKEDAAKEDAVADKAEES